jgi:uncharacterized protein DUF4375
MSLFDSRLRTREPLSWDNAPALVEEVSGPLWKYPYPRDGSRRLSWQWRFVGQPQREIYALVWLEREVSNGGLAQYFWNPLGFFSEDAVNGCRRFVVPALEEVMGAALAVFPDGRPSKIRRERMRILSQLAADQKLIGNGNDYAHELSVLNEFVFRDLNHRSDKAIESMYEPIALYIRNHMTEFFR